MTLYVSTDIEADGPIPGDYSMLSIGSAAFKEDGTIQSTFTRNLWPLEGASQNSSTMKWWATQPEAWEEVNKDRVWPGLAMKDYVKWVYELGDKAVFVAYPAGFDWTFVYWYMMHFVGKSPFGFSALDMKSYASALLRTDYRSTTKRTMPKKWFSPAKHNHIALDDAIEQGHLFMAMLAHGRPTENEDRSK